jgi:NADH-quinone oxidoreductase subunit L
MTLPLIVLAVLSAVGGFMGIPHMSWLEHWLDPIFEAPGISGGAAHAVQALHEASAGAVHAGDNMEWVLMGVSVAGAIFGILFAFNLYKDLTKPAELKRKWAGLHKTLTHKWYVDEIYEASIVRPIQALSIALWKGFDVAVIDRIVLGFGRVSQWSGQTARVLQNGSIQIYALMIALGIVASVGYLIYGMV